MYNIDDIHQYFPSPSYAFPLHQPGYVQSLNGHIQSKCWLKLYWTYK